MVSIPGNSALMVRLKRRVKVHLAAAKILAGKRRPNQGMILCFHGFQRVPGGETRVFQTSRYELELTIRILKRIFRFVHLEEALKTAVEHGNRTLPLAAVTIDDGFSSVSEVMDIFEKNRVVPTVFVCPDLIDQETVPFPEIVRIAVLIARHPVYSNPDQSPLRNNGFRDRLEASGLMIEYFKKVPPKKLRERTDEFLAQLRVPLEAVKAHPFYDPLLTWEQIKSMLGSIEIGSHTLNHYHLPSLPDNEAMKEIALSKTFIEQKLNRECPYFCYPFGDNRSFGQREMEYVRTSGYHAGFSIESGYLSSERPNTCLPRFNGIIQFARYCCL